MFKSFLGIAIIGFLSISCSDNAVFDTYESLPGYWEKDSLVTFYIVQPDTIAPFNAFINLRTNSDYRYNNLFLITEMNFPNGKVVTDTLEYEMAYPNGKYMGEGFGDVKKHKLWYKENIRFNEDGSYTLKVRQAMRENGDVNPIEKLDGITEVGFRLEPASN